MAQIGNDRRVYITSGKAASSGVWVEGETSNSYNRTAETIEVSDKETKWKAFLAGQKSATAEVSVHLDNTASSQQAKLLKSFSEGTTVFVFIGIMNDGDGTADGDAFEALITAVNDSNDENSVASRTISLQVTGEPVHFPNA